MDFNTKFSKQSATLTQHDLQIGLKTQIHSEEAKRPPSPTHSPNIVHCYALSRASKRPEPQSSSSLSSSLSSASRSSTTDDVIGTESGDCTSSSLCNVEGLKKMPEKSEPPNNHSGSRYRNAMTKQYPQPIPLLAQTGNWLGRVPLVFQRETTEDGSLIIAVKRREYLMAERENGRLVMKLIPANDAVCCEYCGSPPQLEEEEAEEVGDASYDDGVEVEEESASEGSKETERDRCGDLKCHTYGGRVARDSDPFWKVHGIGGTDGHLGQPATPVM